MKVNFQREKLFYGYDYFISIQLDGISIRISNEVEITSRNTTIVEALSFPDFFFLALSVCMNLNGNVGG